MSLQTVEGYPVCANHAHLVDATDLLRKLVNGKQAEAVTILETHDPRYVCACGHPAFWMVAAVRIVPGRYVEAEIERPRVAGT